MTSRKNSNSARKIGKNSELRKSEKSETDKFLKREFEALHSSRKFPIKKKSQRIHSHKSMPKKSSLRGIPRPNSTKNIRENKQNLVKVSQYKDVEIKRRKVRLQKQFVDKNEKLEYLRKKLVKNSGKKNNKMKQKLIKRFDKKDSIDTLDQTYGMIKLKIDSSREVREEKLPEKILKKKKNQLRKKPLK